MSVVSVRVWVSAGGIKYGWARYGYGKGIDGVGRMDGDGRGDPVRCRRRDNSKFQRWEWEQEQTYVEGQGRTAAAAGNAHWNRRRRDEVWCTTDIRERIKGTMQLTSWGRAHAQKALALVDP